MTIDKDKYSKYLTAASNSFLSKGWIYLLLVGGLYILYKAIFRTSLPNFLAFSMLPLVTAAFLLILKYSKQGFYTPVYPAIPFGRSDYAHRYSIRNCHIVMHLVCGSHNFRTYHV